MSIFIDVLTLERVSAYLNLSEICRKSGVNRQSLSTRIRRKSYDEATDDLHVIAETLADEGVFIKRDDETHLEFAARVTAYAHEKIQSNGKVRTGGR